jgi:hypothetical protein
MRVRPTEKKLVRNLLLNETWEDEEECALAIITQLDRMRETNRDYWVLAVQNPTAHGITTRMYGPFGTRKDAERAYSKGMGQVGAGDKVAIFPLTTPLQAERALSI